MHKWYQLFPKNTWLSIYIWIIFCILPFFFIFRSSSLITNIIGILMVVLFFLSYRYSYLSKGWLGYLWVIVGMLISCVMTFLFGYVYFSLFLAFFIGNIRQTVGFFILYGIHVATTLIAIGYGAFLQQDLFISQFPFVIICILGVILLPFNLFNRNRREQLEGQLEIANKRISQLIVAEERQRIARDLHDTLGQKLSLIGLKSDLAHKILDKKPAAAKKEILDVQQTARVALKEVRELVTNMRGVKLEDEIVRVENILQAADIKLTIDGNLVLSNIPLLVENVLSMCLKEAVTNIVKHSKAEKCKIVIEQLDDEVLIKVNDDGIGSKGEVGFKIGHGLQGMRERLEFVNGSLAIDLKSGTTLTMRVPNVIKHTVQEG